MVGCGYLGYKMITNTLYLSCLTTFIAI